MKIPVGNEAFLVYISELQKSEVYQSKNESFFSTVTWWLGPPSPPLTPPMRRLMLALAASALQQLHRPHAAHAASRMVAALEAFEAEAARPPPLPAAAAAAATEAGAACSSSSSSCHLRSECYDYGAHLFYPTGCRSREFDQEMASDCFSKEDVTVLFIGDSRKWLPDTILSSSGSLFPFNLSFMC